MSPPPRQLQGPLSASSGWLIHQPELPAPCRDPVVVGGWGEEVEGAGAALGGPERTGTLKAGYWGDPRWGGTSL